jgi:glycosyltransferase involved in cell wall biosynthesis
MQTRVALVIGQLGYGGAEGQLAQLAFGLAGGPLSPIVYCLSDRMQPHGTWLQKQGIRVRQLGGRSDAARTVVLTRWLRADEPALVHSFLYIANRYSFLATRFAGTRTLVTSARNCKRDPRLVHWLLDRAAFRASSAIVCNSETVAHYIARVYGAPLERATIVYNGVDLNRFRPPPSPRPAQPPTIGTVGRVTTQKNPELFLTAAATLLRRRPGCRFTVLGDGDGLPAARQTAAEMRIADAVTFPGARLDVAETLRGLDVFWLTSSWEGTPNALLEAMASGVPVVATDVGACREVIEDGVTGFLVAPDDPDGFARSTEALLADPGLAARMAARARERVATRFSLEQMVRATSDLYQRCLTKTVNGWKHLTPDTLW